MSVLLKQVSLYLETQRVDEYAEYEFTQYLRVRGEFLYSFNSGLYAVNF